MAAPPGADVVVGEDILSTRRDAASNTIFAQTGDVIAEEAQGQECEFWQHVGFCSRPPQAVQGKTCAQAVTVRGSQRDAVVASRDLRAQEMYGLLSEGETCLYAAGKDGNSQARILLKDDGSINIVTTDTNTKDGVTIQLTVGPKGQQIVTPWGGFIISKTGIQAYTQDGATPGGMISMSKDGVIQAVGKNILLRGSSVVLGTGDTPAGFAPVAIFPPGSPVPIPSTCVFAAGIPT